MLVENLKTGYVPSFGTGPGDPPLAPYGIGTTTKPHTGAPGLNMIEGTWANPHPLFAAVHFSDDICDASGQCNIGESITVISGGTNYAVKRADWGKANSLDARSNPQSLPESINGALYAYEGWTYPNSLHPGGVVVCMCDGSARFISSDINGDVWAKLFTPGGSRGMRETWPVYQQAVADDNF